MNCFTLTIGKNGTHSTFSEKPGILPDLGGLSKFLECNRTLKFITDGFIMKDYTL